MTAPTNPFGAITLVEIQAGKPCKQELKEKFRSNDLRAFEVLLAAGVSPDDAAVAVGHRHLGPDRDGTATISPQPQENLITGSDRPSSAGGWSEGATTPAGDIAFDDVAGNYQFIKRSNGNVGVNPISLTQAFLSADIIKKIKSAGGKGRFSCSMHMKRLASAAGVVGGTLRFGIYDGAAFVSGAHCDIDFDDVGQEYIRFYFTSDQITRPAALNLRSEWVGDPTDWDTVGQDDVIGHHGGYMVTNGAGVPKWDISHFDGGNDDYDADSGNLLYWWDENITEEEQTVL